MVTQRFLGNVGFRLAFTFLRPFSVGTGLTIQQLGTVLALRDLLGLGAPAAGRLSDRYGATRLMIIGGWVTVAGLLITALGRTGLIVGFLVFGAGKLAYDIPMNAWVSDRVAYERRGKALGWVEVSWAAAALVGIPICGLLIDRVSWRAAPVAIGVAMIPALFGVARRIEPATTQSAADRVKPTLSLNSILALAALCTLTFCSQLLFVGHGLWLGDTYGFDAAKVGFAVITLGVVEACASLSTTVLADRLGKRIAMIGGCALMVAGMVALAIQDAPTLGIGLAFLAAAFLGFEFAFVSALPLISELDPAARAQMIGLGLGASTAARAVGSFIGAPLYERSGFDALMTLGAGAGLVGIAVMIFGMVEPATPQLAEGE